MDFFETLAECSVAFGGFAAIHAALRSDSGPRESMRQWTTVCTGLLVFLLSILPLLFHQVGVVESAMWRALSAVGIVSTGLVVLSVGVLDRRLNRLGHSAQFLGLLRTSIAMLIASTLAMVANLAGVFGPPGPELYAVSLVIVLATGVNGLLGSFWMPLRAVFESNSED